MSKKNSNLSGIDHSTWEWSPLKTAGKHRYRFRTDLHEVTEYEIIEGLPYRVQFPDGRYFPWVRFRSEWKPLNAEEYQRQMIENRDREVYRARKSCYSVVLPIEDEWGNPVVEETVFFSISTGLILREMVHGEPLLVARTDAEDYGSRPNVPIIDPVR